MTDDYPSPVGWHWGIGSAGGDHYTNWMYTDSPMWECVVYSDRVGEHNVEFLPVEVVLENGDYEYGYPEYCETFETKDEALAYAVETAAGLQS